MNNLHLLKARELADLVNTGQITAVEITKYFLERAQTLNPKIKAFNCITEDLALSQAQKVDEQIQSGVKLPMAGVPIGIKDNLNVIGTKTTCSSKILENYESAYESTVTSRLWEAGAVCIGKTNLDEFAMGSSTENSAFGVTANPYNVNCVPGGSSGGSAACVSARMVPVSIGSDTGGSIRQPASLCGVVGYKPTYGLVSRYGLVAFASSLDQVGPFATDIEDTHLVLSVIAGHDPKDSTSIKEQSKLSSLAEFDLSKLRVGIVKEFQDGDIHPDIRQSFDEMVESLKSAGATISELSTPITAKYALDCYYIIAPAEASSNLSRYDGVRFGHRDKQADNLIDMYIASRSAGFGAEVKRRIIIGTYALSAGYYDAYYKKALQVRRLITEEYQKAFEQVDVILTPTSAIPAFSVGSKVSDPLSMYMCDVMTIPVNLAGLPAISFNTGFTQDNLPIGMQLIAPNLRDNQLLEMSQAINTQIVKTEEFPLPSGV